MPTAVALPLVVPACGHGAPLASEPRCSSRYPARTLPISRKKSFCQPTRSCEMPEYEMLEVTICTPDMGEHELSAGVDAALGRWLLRMAMRRPPHLFRCMDPDCGARFHGDYWPAAVVVIAHSSDERRKVLAGICGDCFAKGDGHLRLLVTKAAKLIWPEGNFQLLGEEGHA